MKVLVAGDYAYSQSFKDLIDTKRYDLLFGDVKDIISKVDVSIVNYENPVLLDKQTYKPIIKIGQNLCSPQSAVEAIAYAGFNVATLANNHILDYGSSGCIDTITTLNNYNIATVGAGNNIEEAKKVLYRRVGNEVLGIINCCEHEFSIADESRAGANPLSPIQQFYSIQEARQKANYVIVVVHGGHEYYQLPSPRMQETYRFFIDVGADAVVNHHQHCYSGYEYYKEKPIIYGLGNFCFNSKLRNSSWNEGYLALLTFNSSQILLEVVPYIQCNDKLGVFLVTERTDFDHKIKELNDVVSNSQKLKAEVIKYYNDQYKNIESVFEPYTNRYLLKLRSLKIIPSFVPLKKWLKLFNIMECEAHRDKLFNVLEDKCQGR